MLCQQKKKKYPCFSLQQIEKFFSSYEKKKEKILVWVKVCKYLICKINEMRYFFIIIFFLLNCESTQTTNKSKFSNIHESYSK